MKPISNVVLIFILITIASCSSSFLNENEFTIPSVKEDARLIYPQEAIENNISGEMKLLLEINSKGIVEEVGILESSGYKILDDAGLDYCSKLVFNPAMQGNKAVRANVAKTLVFRFSERKIDNSEFVDAANDLHNSILDDSTVDVAKTQEEIIKLYDSKITELRDGWVINSSIYDIIVPQLSAEWRDCCNG